MDKELAYKLFETDMTESAKHGYECIMSHEECAKGHRIAVANIFRKYMFAENVSLPDSELALACLAVRGAVQDTTGATWVAWTGAPGLNDATNLVSVSEDGETLGIWNPVEGVQYATVKRTDNWAVTAATEMIVIDPKYKISIMDGVKAIQQQLFKSEVEKVSKKFPTGKSSLSEPQYYMKRNEILNAIFKYSQGEDPEYLRNVRTIAQLAGMDSFEGLMKAAYAKPLVLFMYCLSNPIEDSEGKHWVDFMPSDDKASVIGKCVEDGTIASIDTDTLLFEWFYSPDKEVSATTITSTHQINRRCLHNVATTTLQKLLEAPASIL